MAMILNWERKVKIGSAVMTMNVVVEQLDDEFNTYHPRLLTLAQNANVIRAIQKWSPPSRGVWGDRC
jgi:hypothetical protein